MSEVRKNYYGSLCTEMYEILHERAPEDELNFYLSYAEKGKKILEPLCGSGRFLIPFIERGFDITGIDMSNEMLEKLKLKFPDAKTVHTDIMKYDPKEKFDYIFISSGSVSLFTDIDICKQILIRIKKWLLKTGKFVFAVDTIKNRCIDDNDYNIAAGVMGSFASVDWTRQNGVIDIAFKQVDGLTPTVTSEGDASVLDSKFYSYYGKFATKNTQFDFIYKGLIVGDYVNISTYINAIWLNESFKNAVLSGITATGKISYNDTGYTLIRAWLSDPINQAINNGIIQTGVVLSETQKAQIISEVGSDITSELTVNGYYLLITDPGATARATGDSPIITFYYTDGGVVKKLQIASTAIL